MSATRRSTTDLTSAARHILEVDELDQPGGKGFYSTRQEPSLDGSAIEVRPDGTYVVRFTSFELHHRSLLIATGSVGAAPSADMEKILTVPDAVQDQLPREIADSLRNSLDSVGSQPDASSDPLTGQISLRAEDQKLLNEYLNLSRRLLMLTDAGNLL